ncbi:hypothetical protein C8T65DRAFT_744408 [Cerioporus squamosus]|nr:hypothetical protein C8T65DRAFT_744408 [Cerioporus squamosus]
MGRTAKYRTRQERALAKKAAKQRYAATDRGRAAIHHQNLRTYKRRVAAIPEPEPVDSRDIKSVDIPEDLISLSRQPIIPTRLFLKALQCADALDESNLGVWDARPPYNTLPTHMEDDEERRFTNRIVEVMHGRRMRETRAEDEERVARLQAGCYEDVVGELQERDAQYTAPELPGSKRDKRMAQFHLEWAAKRLCLFHAELTSLQSNGLGPFSQLYSDGGLGWRSVFKGLDMVP